LTCEKAVDIRVWRCEPCRIEYDETDPFAITAREEGAKVALLAKAIRGVLEAVYVGDGAILCPPALVEPIRDLVKAMKEAGE
jgi:hypothetical protein